MIQRYTTTFPIIKDDDGDWCKAEDVYQLEALNKEMLDFLIKTYKWQKTTPLDISLRWHHDTKLLIEKATGKPIDEVLK